MAIIFLLVFFTSVYSTSEDDDDDDARAKNSYEMGNVTFSTDSTFQRGTIKGRDGSHVAKASAPPLPSDRSHIPVGSHALPGMASNHPNQYHNPFPNMTDRLSHLMSSFRKHTASNNIYPVATAADSAVVIGGLKMKKLFILPESGNLVLKVFIVGKKKFRVSKTKPFFF